MKFSIITVCYNEEKRIEKTLESVYCQKYTDYEHIIEDGKSTDNTINIVSQCACRYPAQQLQIYSEKDLGLYDAMNRAIIRARGEYICFINSGDFLQDENTLKKVAVQMNLCPGMDIYYGSCIVIFPNGNEYIQVTGSIENIPGNDISKELKSKPLSIIHQSIFAHKDCFCQNMFDTKYHLRAELKWYYKCFLSKCKVKRLDFPVCRYSLGGLSERVDSVAINAIETNKIFEELQLITDKNKSLLPCKENSSERFRTIYNQWLGLHQAGKHISDYLKKKDIRQVAIYGYAELGTHLVNELKNTEINITCLIDQKELFPYSGIRTIQPESFKGDADLVIVTSLVHFNEIREYYRSKNINQLVSLETILEDMWNY